MATLPVDEINRDSFNQVPNLIDTTSRGGCGPVEPDTRRNGSGMLESQAAPFVDCARGKFMVRQVDNPLEVGSSVAFDRCRENRISARHS